MRSGGEIGRGWAWRVVAEMRDKDHRAVGGVLSCADSGDNPSMVGSGWPMLSVTPEGPRQSHRLWGAGEGGWGGRELRSPDGVAEVPLTVLLCSDGKAGTG